MWVILPDAQIMLVDNVGPHPRPRPLKKKKCRKRNYTMKIFPERNVKDCSIVIICLCMGLHGFQRTFTNIISFFLTVIPEKGRARIPGLSF